MSAPPVQAAEAGRGGVGAGIVLVAASVFGIGTVVAGWSPHSASAGVVPDALLQPSP